MPSDSNEPRTARGSGLRQRTGAPIFLRPTPCGYCGYDLLGLPLTAKCPECGTRAGETAPRQTHAASSRPPGTAPRQTICHQCGYDLAGLEPGGRCPECGTPSIVHLTGAVRDTLGDARLEYLLTLAGGLLLAACAGLGYLFVAFVGVFTIGSLGVLVTCVGATGAAWLAGVLLILRQRPGGGRDRELDAHGREWWTLRRFIGWTQGAAALACAVEIVDILSTAAGTGPAPGGWLTTLAWPGWRWIDWALSVVAIIGWPPLCYYLARLADWAPDETLTRWFRHTGSFIGLGVLIAGVALLARQFAPFRVLLFFSSTLLLVLPLACLCMLVLMLHFAWTIRWARKNMIERLERDARVALRARLRAEDMANRSLAATGLDRPPAAEIDHRLMADVEAAHTADAKARTWSDADLEAQRRASTAVHRLQPSSDRSGYALEDDPGTRSNAGPAPPSH